MEHPELGPVRSIRTRDLEVGYVDTGPGGGDPVILLHGYPYDIHSYSEVVPLLAAQGRRVIVPYLRGHGPTRSLTDAARSGQQAALGSDLVALMDALGLDRATYAGYDWGGRAGCVAAALWPERCDGIVSVNGYLIQDIEAAARPIAPALEAGFWYFHYFATERGRAGLTANRAEIARIIWTRNSPRWSFSEADLERAARAFENPDYVDIVIHSYRHRLGLAPGHPDYAALERRLAQAPPVTAPAVTLDGAADGNFPATDGTGSATHFTGAHAHHIVPEAGHNLPQEAPQAFADAVLELAGLGGSSRHDALRHPTTHSRGVDDPRERS